MHLHTAINVYHALLDEATARETFQLLDRAIRARKMLVGANRDRLVCEVLRPRLLVPAQAAILQQATQAVGRAIQVVGEAALHDPALLAPYALTSDEQVLLTLDPGYAGASRFGRLDGFLDPEGQWCYFVESNLESPAGIAYEDGLAEDFLSLPVMQAFIKDYPVSVAPLWRSLHATLLEAWTAWGGTGTPTIAIVDFAGAVTMPEFELLRERFRAAGTPTLIADPAELRYDGRELYVEQAGQRTAIGLVYRRILQHEFLATYDLRHPLVRAYADGRVCVVNPFRSKPVHTKLIMALISDEDGPGWPLLDPVTQAAVQAHVPWTRIVRAGPTRYQGEQVPDLLDFIADNRERLVLKPNDAYGGSGVILGWTNDETSWRAALAEALRGPWVVQERVPLPEEAYPTWSPATGLRFTPRYVDSDPCVFGSAANLRAEGCLTRIAATPLLNVSAGGGAAPPTFFLR
ncbi:MAG: hypothetical protein AB4911_15255 [Oscillochloridaceae bacterium umkhey_bin13]